MDAAAAALPVNRSPLEPDELVLVSEPVDDDEEYLGLVPLVYRLLEGVHVRPTASVRQDEPARVELSGL